MIMERVAEFLGKLLHHCQLLKEGQTDMSVDLKSILTKLDAQGKDIAAQGKQIDQLLAAASAQEQADLDQIDSLLDANATASAANATKLLGALTPATEPGGDAPSSSTVTVATPSTAPAGIITVTGDVPTIGSAVAGVGITSGATVQDAVAGPADGQATITLSQPTEADHAGGEQLVVTPPVS